MSLLDKMKGVRYRARIFDHNLFLFTVEVPDRGQRKIEVTLQKKILGIIGEEKKIALIINPRIPPKLFGGYIQEVDFDVRDAAQLADILSIAPEFVCEIEETFKKIVELQKSPDVAFLTEPVAIPEAPPVPTDGTTEKKEDEKKSPFVPKKPGLIKVGAQLAGNFLALRTAIDDTEKRQLIQDCLDLCKDHPTLFYLLPHELKIDQEIKAVCAQSVIWRAGVIPSYYIAQYNATISEKILARPPQKQGWEQVVIIGIIAAAILGTLGLVVYALTK